MIDWMPLVRMIDSHRHFLLTTHVRPDGDGLGSMLALGEVLERRHKLVEMVVASSFPTRYRFLDPQGRIKRFTAETNHAVPPDMIIVLDTGTWNQLGDFGPVLRSSPAAKAVIDHHRTQDDLGAVPFIDASAEATGRLVYELIQALGDHLPEQAAQSLFVAIAMDTGWFHHGNTTSASFDLASSLVCGGARPDEVYVQLFEENTLPRLKLMGLVLDRLQLAKGGLVAYTEIHRSDYAATGASPQDTEDLVNFTRSIAGVEVGLLFMEQPRGGVKISFRSRSRVDVSRVAEGFGGGGHRLASGAVIDAPLEEARARVLDSVSSTLDSAG